MANHQQQGRRQGESTMEKAGEGERTLATRQYQDPFSLLDSMFERMQRDFFGTSLFNALLPARGTETEGGVPRVPRMQIRDTGDAIEVTAELPGVDPDDVKVECDDDVLTIHAETRKEEEREGERTERCVGFYRQVALPEGIDPEQGKASCKNGVLSIRFPKRTERGNVR